MTEITSEFNVKLVTTYSDSSQSGAERFIFVIDSESKPEPEMESDPESETEPEMETEPEARMKSEARMESELEPEMESDPESKSELGANAIPEKINLPWSH